MALQNKAQKIFSVSEINSCVHDFLESAFQQVFVRGEISNFRAYPSGHFYFTLKDETSQLSAVMFRACNRLLKFKPEDGLRVIARGKLTLYEARGQYQMTVDVLEPDGIGALQMAFEQLKKKLAAEGLFDQQHKKPLPFLPGRVGVVTSESGAAIHDILTVLKRRFPNIDVLLFPVKVQGEGAAGEIVQALDYFSAQKNADVLIVGRGGGLMEDLWSFNEENVARAIFRCPIPVISAVGHEIDFTIADFVADLRAPTPSVAAELAVPDKNQLAQKLTGLEDHLYQTVVLLLRRRGMECHSLQLRLASPQNRISVGRERLRGLAAQLQHLFLRECAQRKHRFAQHRARLELLSPKNILKRGYTIARRPAGSLVTRWQDLAVGEDLALVFFDGELLTTVKEKI